uniref:PNPLA domain-containing protein n=1 Tax=Soboliphyme baturini TaxID=241478 RepID=A0A183J7D9_9BILA
LYYLDIYQRLFCCIIVILQLGLIACVVNQPKLSAFIFRNYSYPSHKASAFPGGCDFHLWEALKASAAAPGYFQDHKVNGYILQDGGIIANNPTAIGIHESRALWSLDVPFQCVVSIGNGTFAPVQTPKEAENFTFRDKVIKIIDSATETENVHTVLSDLLPASRYYRLNPYMSVPYSLDDCSDELLKNMQQDALCYIEKNMVKLNSLAKKLEYPTNDLIQNSHSCLRDKD